MHEVISGLVGVSGSAGVSGSVGVSGSEGVSGSTGVSGSGVGSTVPALCVDQEPASHEPSVIV